MNVETRREAKRGCGYRKEGGLYLVCEGNGRACERMPIPLDKCPTCSQGIKPSRGWTWVDSKPILEANPCKQPENCSTCPLVQPMGRVGLLWVGEKYYPMPHDFLAEAKRMGISRRIPAIPQGFEIGKHWVWLAHRKTFWPSHKDECGFWTGHECSCDAEFTPGVFHVFMPSRIEYVVKSDDDEEKLQRLVERDVTLVKIEKLDENLNLIN